MHTPETQGRARLVAALAVILVVFVGGGAAAGTLITSKMIKNDTINPVDLNFVLGQKASLLDVSTPIVGPDFTSVLDQTMVVGDGGGTATAQADVQVSNPTAKPITVTLRLTHLQDPGHTLDFVNTIPPNSTISVPAGLLCNGFHTGKQTVDLSVSGAGAVVDHALLTMVATPAG